MPKWPSWFDSMPVELRARAYIAAQEAAWTRDDAIAVIKWGQRQGLEILGVEVWLATRPGPTIPGPYLWESAMAAPGEAAPLSKRERAMEFVRNFQWHPDDQRSKGLEPYFNLTFA